MHRCKFTLDDIKCLSGLRSDGRINKTGGRIKRILDTLQGLVECGALCIEKDNIADYTPQELICAEWFPPPSLSQSYVALDESEYERIIERNPSSMTMYDLSVFLYIKSKMWFRSRPEDFKAECAKVSQEEISKIMEIDRARVSRTVSHLANDLEVISYQNISPSTICTDQNDSWLIKPKSVYVLRHSGWKEELAQGVAEYTDFLQELVFKKKEGKD